jgi:hypothetical protein
MVRAHESVHESSEGPERRRDDAQDRPVVLAGGQGLAAVAPGPATSARDAVLLLDRFAMVAEGVVVMHVPVGRRILLAVGVKRRFVRHCAAPLCCPEGCTRPRAAHDLLRVVDDPRLPRQVFSLDPVAIAKAGCSETLRSPNVVIATFAAAGGKSAEEGFHAIFF